MLFLQRYVHIVLDAVLGSYVKNIDPEALKISVWNGKIEVDVVELQPDGIPLPPEFRIVKGTLHRVQIDLPWSNLANQPIRVEVQDVNLLLEVCDRRPEEMSSAHDTETKETAARLAKRRVETLKRKRATIDAIEKATQYKGKSVETSADGAAAGAQKDTKAWTQSLLFKLIVKVLDNVQLNIQHIHIRLEDHVSVPSRPLAVGITLESMVIKSADAQWNYTMVGRGGQASATRSAPSFMRKKIDINKFGLYWTLPLVPVPQSAREDGFAFMRMMQMNFWSGDVAARTGDDTRYAKLFQPEDYVIKPLTLSLKLTINDGRAKLPITHSELCSRVIARLGTPWMVDTISVIGDEPWQEFVKGMPKLAGDRKYTLSFVFSEAWAVAREHNEEEDDVPSVDQFKDALSSCLQWSTAEVERLEPSIVKYRDAVIHVLQEKSTYIDATATIDDISVSLQREQYLSGLKLISFLSLKRRQARYAHLRPVGVRVAENPRRWWLYAISSVMIDVRERLARVDVVAIQQAKSLRHRYKELYLVTLQTKALALPPGLVSSEVLRLPKEKVKEELGDIEVALDTQELLQLRASARQGLLDYASKQQADASKAGNSSIQTQGASPVSDSAQPMSARLWSYTTWLYGNGSNDAKSRAASEGEEIQWSDQDTKVLFDAIDFHPERSDPLEHPVESVNEDGEHIWYRCQFVVSQATLQLMDKVAEDAQKCLVRAALSEVDLKVLVRPKSVELGILLGDASIVGCVEEGSSQPMIEIKRMRVDEIVRHHPASVSQNMSSVRLQVCEKTLPLIDIGIDISQSASSGSEELSVVEAAATSRQAISVSVVAQALKCGVNVAALLEVSSFFARPSNVDLSGLRERAWRQAQRLQRSSAAQIQAALLRRSNVSILVDVISPLLTLRESSPPRVGDVGARQSGVVDLIVFLGHLRASSRTRAIQQRDLSEGKERSHSSGSEVLDSLYDIVDVKLSAIEARIRGADAESVPLLEKTSVNVGIYVSITANDPTIPLVKLIGGVDLVQVDLDAKTYPMLLRLIRSIGADINRAYAERLTQRITSSEDSSGGSTSAVEPSDSIPEDGFFTGIDTETFARTQISSSPVPSHGNALYRLLSRVQDRRPRAEASDKDLAKLWQRVLLLVRFQIREVGIRIRLASSDKNTSVVRVAITAIETDFDMRTYDKSLRFRLGSFFVEEKRSSVQSSRYLIASGDAAEGNSACGSGLAAKEPLIQLMVTSVDVAAPKPEDHAMWDQLRSRSFGGSKTGQPVDGYVWQDPLATWLSIDAQLRSLVMNLHQDAFADLFVFFYQPHEVVVNSSAFGVDGHRAPVSSSGRSGVVRKIAKSPEPTIQKTGSGRGLTTKIGTWVTSSLTGTMSARQKRMEEAVARTKGADRDRASIQLRLHVSGLSLVLHQHVSTSVDDASEESTSGVFIRLVAKDFSCCVHRFPHFLSVFAYLVSMQISDESVPDESLREVLGSEVICSEPSDPKAPASRPSDHVPSVVDVLRAVEDVPAVFSCSAQLYGADQIQEQWHPGYANRFTVRLKSPRLRVLYRFLDDLRSYFFDGILLQTVMRTMFPQRVQIEWDEDFLLSSLSSQHSAANSAHTASPRPPFEPRTANASTIDVVSMFPLVNVRLTDARLRIPVHRTSSEALVVRLDSFHLSNEYLLEMFSSMPNRVMAKVLLNSSLSQFKVDMEALRVVSVIFVETSWSNGLNTAFAPRAELLTQSLLGSTTMSISVDFSSGATTAIGIEFSPLRLVCNREQYAFLFRLPIQNFGEARRGQRNTNRAAQTVESQRPEAASGVPEAPDDEDEEDEREVLVTIQIPELALEILHGQEGYHPSLSGDMSMAETEKRAQGSICSIHVSTFSSTINYGMLTRSWRLAAELQEMRIRDTRQGSTISPTYRDTVVFNQPSVAGTKTPSISIRVVHGSMDLSSQQERALECSFASPHRRLRRSAESTGEDTGAHSDRPYRKMSSSFFGSETLTGLHHSVPHRAASNMSVRSSRASRSSESNSDKSDRRRSGSSAKVQPSMRTDLVVDVEGFRIIPSNIHYDVLRFLESPGRGRWESDSSTKASTVDDEAEVTASPNLVAAPVLHHFVVTLSLGKSAILLVEDPSLHSSRAVMFSWAASIAVEFLRRPPIDNADSSSSSNRLQVRIDLTSIQATSRLSPNNIWLRADEDAGEQGLGVRVDALPKGKDELAGDFLKPCDLECGLDIDFATEFVRLKSAFDRVLDLRFGYLDVCTLRGAVENVVRYPVAKVDDAPVSSSATRRRQSIGSSGGSTSSALQANLDAMTMTASAFSVSARGSSRGSIARRHRRTREPEPTVLYGSTFLYLVSATFRGPINARPAVGLYSSPWRKRYLVLPFTAQERESVQPTMFRIVPASGSGCKMGDPVRFGDRIGLQTVHSKTVQPPAERDGADGEDRREDRQDVEATAICKYDQLGASGYLGPDGSAGSFETRVWKYGTNAFNSSRRAIRHKDPIVFEELTIYRVFSKGKSYHGSSRVVSAQFDQMEDGDNARMSVEGGGYLMFNGVGDAPIPLVVSVGSKSGSGLVRPFTVSDKEPKDDTARKSSTSKSPPQSSVVALWGKLKVIQFSLPGVNATVVNDFHNMLLPLLHLRVFQLTVDLRGSFESRLTAMAGLQVGIQSYNSQLAVWEPLVEDFDVNVAVHVKGGAVCNYCLSDRHQISLAGTKLRCDGIPVCLFGATKTAVFAAATARASEAKHFIYQELLNHQLATTLTSSGDHDDDAKLATTSLLVIKKGININVTRNGVNVLLQFVDLVSRAASNAEQDAWQSRLGAFVYVDNQSGIPFLVAGHPTTTPPDTTPPTSVSGPIHSMSSLDESSEETVKLPTLSVGSEDGMLVGSRLGSSSSGLGQSSWIDNRQLTAVMKDMMSSSTKWLSVQDGERVPTEIVAHEAPAGSVMSPLRRLMWLRPRSSMSSSKPIPVPIGYSNRSYLHLESSTGYKDPWHGESIICETVAEQGTLVMRLRGKVQLVNHLSFPVEVVYNDKRREVLSPEGRSPHFVPVQFLEGGNMTFCPLLDQGQLQRSTHISISSLLRGPARVKARTKPSTGALEVRRVLTFYWNVHPEEVEDDEAHSPPSSFGVSRPPFQVILTASRKSEKHETLIRISPPIRLENLVPYPLAFRTVCTKSERDLAWVDGNETTFSGTSGMVASGGAGQICELEIFNARTTNSQGAAPPSQVPSAVALSIAIPGIGYSKFSRWSETSFIYGSSNLCSGIELEADEAVAKTCPLRLRLEIVAVERLGSNELNQLAPTVCRVYVEYWLIDRTCLSLVMRTQDGKRIRPWIDGSHAPPDGSSLTPVAIFSPARSGQANPKIRVGVDAEDQFAEESGTTEIKSKPFDISTVGLRGQISLRRKDREAASGLLPSFRGFEAPANVASVHKQFDIGVMIEQGPSIFSRTTVVTFVPRYYFINTSDRFHIWIKQEGDADDNAIKLSTRQGCFFHWNDSRLRNRIQLRFVCVSKYHCGDAGDAFSDDDDDGMGEELLEPSADMDHGMSEWSLPFEVTSVGNFVVRLHRTLMKAASCFGDACFAADDSLVASEASSSASDVCETMTGMSLHVGVELHDPAFVVRFHEGTESHRSVDGAAGYANPALDTAEVRDFVSYKVKNECTAMEIFVWQVNSVDAGASGGSGQKSAFEGGDRVSPFQSMDFVPYAATSSPALHVQVQSFLETPWSSSSSFKEAPDRNGSEVPTNRALGTPRVLCSFDVSLDKLQSLPVIEFNDGKLMKRLWVEVTLEDATKTLRVTDVLPGASSEHRRRRRAALLRSWKRYNTSVRWYSRLLHENRILKELTTEAADDAPSKHKKQVRFAADVVEEEKSAVSSEALSPKHGMEEEEAVVVPAIGVAVRVVDASHLEDLYPADANVSGLMPFVRVRLVGRSLSGKPAARSLRTQSSKSVFPRWVPGFKTSRRSSGEESDVVVQSFAVEDMDDGGEREEEFVEVEVREGNKVLFGSTILGSGRVHLTEYLASLRAGSSAPHPRVHDLFVGITGSASESPKGSRTMVRVQLTGAMFEDHTLAPKVLAQAIRDQTVEVQLDRLVRCKSQLKVQLERDSVDLALQDGASKPTAAVAANDPTANATASQVPILRSSERSTSLETRSVSGSSHVTDDSASDAGNEGIPFDERVLSVVVVGVSNLLISPIVTHGGEEEGSPAQRQPAPSDAEQKVYCTVTYRDSTRSAASSVAKQVTRPSTAGQSDQESSQRPHRPRMVRTHQFPRGVKLGLDLVYHRGRVVIQGVACQGPCSQLAQDGEISIGDTIVAVNDKSIVNLHRDACFRAIAQACAAAPELDDDIEPAPKGKITKTVSLSFLRQIPSSFNAPSAADENGRDVPRFEAEWNRRLEFVDSNDDASAAPVTVEDLEVEDVKNKVLVRVYVRNEQSDHGLTAAQEPSVVPFLYFFGDEETMDHLDHSKEDTRFDQLLGEAWVPLPSRTQNPLEDMSEMDPSATECVCALYAPKTDDHATDAFFTSTARAMIGQVRIALKWEYRNSMAHLQQQHQLRAFVQLEVQGLFISIIDDGNGGVQRRTPREVLSISLSARNADTGIQVCYGLVSDGRHVLNTRIGHLQVDNQLLDTNYPVMVFPIRLDDTVQQDQAAASGAQPRAGSGVERGPLPEATRPVTAEATRLASGDRILLPTFQLMGVFSKRRTLFQFEYIFAQLQELDVKVEDAVLVATAQALSGINWSLVRAASSANRVDEQAKQSNAATGNAALSLVDARWPFPNTPVFPLAMLNVEHRGGNMKVLLRWLLFCPIKMNITFTSTTDRANLLSLVSPEMSSVLRTLISAAAALVSNLDNAAIKVPEFYVENVLETTHTLGFYTMQHYLNHGLRSWYRIVGSVDFLGNPIGLVSALGAGVKDFFYTPAHMLLDDEDGLRIENLRTGMTKGSKSLLRNTAVGIFHTTGKITETLGKGIALLAMDDEYNIERQRQTIRQKKKINDLGDAIAEGGKGFAGGVWDGVKGVVAAPVRGAERDGAGGFVVGIGQGVAGLFVKPAAGFLDMLTSLSRGAKSSAQTIDGGYDQGALAATRVRLPRRICADGVLVAFSEREARGCAILALTSLDLTDDYVFHLDYGVETQRGLLLLTDKRIICLSGKSGQKLWEVALDSSLQVEATDATLNIAQSKQSNKVYKIACDNETEAANFKLAVSSARLDLSATRYLLLNLEKKQEEARQNAVLGVLAGGDIAAEDGRVDLSLLMGNIQDTMVTGLSEQDLRTQPLRSVQVELCHLENKDAVGNVPSRAIDRLLSFSVFQILVYGGPYQWTVYRRFSEFRELYAALDKTGHTNMDALPPLPARTFLPSTRSAVATQRQEALSNFLQAAIMHSSISGSQAMLEFLTRNAQEVRVSLPPLSPTARSSGGGGGPATSNALRSP